MWKKIVKKRDHLYDGVFIRYHLNKYVDYCMYKYLYFAIYILFQLLICHNYVETGKIAKEMIVYIIYTLFMKHPVTDMEMGRIKEQTIFHNFPAGIPSYYINS